MSNGQDSATAYVVPGRSFVCLEHPGIIKNIETAVETLGGQSEMSKILDPGLAENPANLWLHPKDCMSKSLASTPLSTQNVLLKVTVPKRTGRKRKRGSDDPFRDESENGPTMDSNIYASTTDQQQKRPNCYQLRRSLQDNPDKYRIEAVGSVGITHRWRRMPDFVYSTSYSPLANEFRAKVVPFEYERLRQFNVDAVIEHELATDLMPPPSFTNHSVPFNYGFRQNPAVKHALDSKGNVASFNISAAPKAFSYVLPSDVSSVPTHPHPSCPPRSSLDQRLMAVVVHLDAMMQERPIWTRRAMTNGLKQTQDQPILKLAIPHVGYVFRSGPWRDTIIKYGLDPRTDPRCRMYQTMVFKLEPRQSSSTNPMYVLDNGRKRFERPTIEQKSEQQSHIFDGIHLNKEAKTYAICDIVDPLLKKVLSTEDIRDECDTISDGWFHNGTMAKAKVIMRAKFTRLLEGQVPDDRDFMLLTAIPDHITDTNKHLARLGKDATVEQLGWALQIRSWATTPPAARIPRMHGEVNGTTGWKTKASKDSVMAENDEDQSPNEEEDPESMDDSGSSEEAQDNAIQREVSDEEEEQDRDDD